MPSIDGNNPDSVLQVATFSLLELDGFEQRLKVARSKSLITQIIKMIKHHISKLCHYIHYIPYLMIVSLDHFQEQRRPILHVLAEDLQQIPVLIEIDQNLQLLQHFQVLRHLDAALGQPLAQRRIIVGRNRQELHAARPQTANGRKDVAGVERNVLHTGSGIIVDVLLDLRTLLAQGRLVDGHFDRLLVVADDNRTKRRVFGVDLLVVDRPEAMELQIALVPFGSVFHL